MQLKIADMLSVAINQLACCSTIMNYPKKYSKNFDPCSPVDNFWMNASKTFFYDSLQLTSTLLSKNSRSPTISMFNWQEFSEIYHDWLDEIATKLNDSGLKTVRDQVIAHLDDSNHNNRFPRHRRQGVMNEMLIDKLREIQLEIVVKFDEYTRNIGSPYDLVNFFSGNEGAQEADLAINGNKPTLTNNFVI